MCVVGVGGWRGGGGGSDVIVGLLDSIRPLHKEEFSQKCGCLHKNVHFPFFIALDCC